MFEIVFKSNLCGFLLGAAPETLFISGYISMYNPWPVSVVAYHPEGHVLADGSRQESCNLAGNKSVWRTRTPPSTSRPPRSLPEPWGSPGAPLDSPRAPPRPPGAPPRLLEQPYSTNSARGTGCRQIRSFGAGFHKYKKIRQL